MKLALFQHAAPFEIPEQRLARGFDATHELYYSGVAPDSAANQTVSVTNRGPRPVQFELWAVAATGRADALLHAGIVTPGGWRNLPISTMARSSREPIALVLKSNGPLSASLRQDDVAVAPSLPVFAAIAMKHA